MVLFTMIHHTIGEAIDLDEMTLITLRLRGLGLPDPRQALLGMRLGH